MMMERKKMPIVQKICYIFCFIFLLGAFIFLGTRNYKIKELPDNQLFSKEYKTVSQNNHFQVLDSEETLKFLEKGTGIIFFGFPENIWSTSIAEILDTVSIDMNYSPIYYFNFRDERSNNHTNYQGILREIDGFLKTNDEGKILLYAPTVVAIEHGNVFFFDDEVTFNDYKMTPKDYWASEKLEKKKLEYKKVLERIRELQENGKK